MLNRSDIIKIVKEHLLLLPDQTEYTVNKLIDEIMPNLKVNRFKEKNKQNLLKSLIIKDFNEYTELVRNDFDSIKQNFLLNEMIRFFNNSLNKRKLLKKIVDSNELTLEKRLVILSIILSKKSKGIKK